MRRSYALAAAALLLVAGGVATVVILVGDGFGNSNALTRTEYLDRIQAICRTYDRKLQRIPPPANPGNAQALAQSIGQALPLLERRLAEARKVKPPPRLVQRVRRAFALADKAVLDLKTSRSKALAGDAGGAVRAFAHFIETRDRARQLASSIGFTC
jgi:biopolymer transport protein ExbB/TolQ